MRERETARHRERRAQDKLKGGNVYMTKIRTGTENNDESELAEGRRERRRWRGGISKNNLLHCRLYFEGLR
jgi:hypothetical protein